MTVDEFLAALDQVGRTTLDRALGLLWFVGRQDSSVSATTKELCDIFERNGYPKQNASRLAKKLTADRRVAKAGPEGWRLTPRARQAFDVELSKIVSGPKPIIISDSVLPLDLFVDSRGYIENVVRQINASYDYGLYDCCAVMCRRLLETLLIEVYETAGRAQEIKAKDGHFFMFAPLLAFFESDTTVHASRNAMKGLREFKQLGDLSAHNRRFNAHRNDIERIRDGLRVAAGELLVMAKLTS